jgi:hypothetical protein
MISQVRNVVKFVLFEANKWCSQVVPDRALPIMKIGFSTSTTRHCAYKISSNANPIWFHRISAGINMNNSKSTNMRLMETMNPRLSLLLKCSTISK